MLKDKIALVTGSSRGIGAATAKRLAAHGAKVVVNYVRAQAQGEAVVAEIQAAGGEALLAQADVTKFEDVARMMEEIKAAFGSIDILVNNASISFSHAPFVEHSWGAFEQKLLGEMKASFYTTQAVTPDMITRKQGCIVNVSSALSRQPAPGFIAHSTAKSALDGFSKSLAMELGRHGIRVNVVAPGLTLTDAPAHMPDKMRHAIAHHTPMGRVADPEDVAGAVLFYCAEWSRFVTGSYLPVSGGIQMI